MKKRIIGGSVVTMLVATGLYVALAQQQEPDVIKFIRSQGVEIVGRFSTPADMTGYAGSYQGEPMSIYVTADNDYAVIGDLIDADGNNLGSEAIYELISAPQNEKIWQQIEKANWVQDGDPNAARIIYTFTDPFCPYCHRFRELAEPNIQAGKVQFRHVVVGILKDDSLEKAATILGSDSPQAALTRHQQRYAQGGIETDREAASKGNDAVLANNQLMEQLHLHATPTSFYRDKNDHVHVIEGMPRHDDLTVMFKD